MYINIYFFGNFYLMAASSFDALCEYLHTNVASRDLFECLNLKCGDAKILWHGWIACDSGLLRNDSVLDFWFKLGLLPFFVFVFKSLMHLYDAHWHWFHFILNLNVQNILTLGLLLMCCLNPYLTCIWNISNSSRFFWQPGFWWSKLIIVASFDAYYQFWYTKVGEFRLVRRFDIYMLSCYYIPYLHALRFI